MNKGEELKKAITNIIKVSEFDKNQLPIREYSPSDQGGDKRIIEYGSLEVVSEVKKRMKDDAKDFYYEVETKEGYKIISNGRINLWVGDKIMWFKGGNKDATSTMFYMEVEKYQQDCTREDLLGKGGTLNIIFARIERMYV